MRKAFLPVLLSSSLALGSGLAGASSASASSRPVTVTSVTATNIHSNGGCRESTIKVHYAAESRIDDVSFEAEVWKGSRYVDTVDVYVQHDGYQSGTYYWCNYEGIGAYTVKHLTVDWSDYEADSNWTGDYPDSHTAGFRVKQASHVYMTSLTRSKTSPTASTKRLITAVVRDRYYRSSAYTWTNWKYHHVYLQRKTSTGWKSVKRAMTGKRGVATLRYVAPSAKAAWWRVYTPGSTKIWFDVSRQNSR